MSELFKKVRKGLQSKINTIDDTLSKAISIKNTFGNNLERLDDGKLIIIVNKILLFLPQAKINIDDILKTTPETFNTEDIERLFSIANEAQNLNKEIGRSKNREDYKLSDQENTLYSVLRNGVCNITQLGEWAVDLKSNNREM